MLRRCILFRNQVIKRVLKYQFITASGRRLEGERETERERKREGTAVSSSARFIPFVCDLKTIIHHFLCSGLPYLSVASLVSATSPLSHSLFPYPSSSHSLFLSFSHSKS